MRVGVTFLGYLRLELGRKEVEIDLPEGASLDEAIGRLVELLGPAAESALLSPRQGFNILISVNGRAMEPSAILADGDRIALFPPSAGGARAFRT